MNAGKHLCASKAFRTIYTRNTTCKAPRKRQQLQLLNKGTSAEGLSVVALGTGGNGPRGPVDNHVYRHWNGDDSNSGWQPSINMFPVNIALVLASMTVAGASPAFAQASLVDHSPESSMLFVGDEWSGSETTAGGAVFQLLPPSYSPTAFTEEEKELVCPRQYRYRETVYVH